MTIPCANFESHSPSGNCSVTAFGVKPRLPGLIVTAAAVLLVLFSRCEFAFGQLATSRSSQSEQRIDDLVKELESPKFSVRQAAAMELWRIGKPAEASLYRALKSSNAEVVARAANILKDFEYGIYPDSDPLTIARIRKFRDGTPTEKVRIARQLIKSRQVISLVKLIKKEPSFQTRQKVSEVFGDRNFLRIYINRNEAPEEALNAISQIAINFKELQISSYLFDDIVADYLWLALTTDSLSSEIEKLKSLEVNENDPYQRLLMLRAYRANNDFDSAMAVAENMNGATKQAAKINLLSELHRWSELSDMTWSDELGPVTELNLSERCESMNFHRLAGNNDRYTAELSKVKRFADELVGDLQLPAGTSWTERVNNRSLMLVVEFLFTCGESDIASEYLKKTDRLQAFEVFNSMARFDEAFAVLGFNDLSDETFKKFNRRIRQFRPKGWDEPAPDITAYCDFAEYLYQLGFYGRAKEAYRSIVFAISQFESDSPDSLRAICQSLINSEQYDLFYELIGPFVNSQNENMIVQTLLLGLEEGFRGTSLAGYWWIVLGNETNDGTKDRMRRLRQFLRQRLPRETLEEEFEELIESVAKRPDLGAIDHANLGLTYLLLNDRDRAKESFRKCISIQDGEFGVGVKLADLYREDNELGLAYDCYLSAWKASTTSTIDSVRLNLTGLPPSPLPLYLAGLVGKELAKAQPAMEGVWQKHVEMARQLMLYGDSNRFVRTGLIDRGFKAEAVEICEMVMKVGGFQDWELGNARSVLIDQLKPEQGLLAANYLESQLHDVASTTRSYTSMASYTYFPNEVQLHRFDQLLHEKQIDEAFNALKIALEFRPHSATIAEEYLPRLREAEDGRELADQLFEQIRAGHLEVLKKFPNSGLYNNNYAWVCTTNKRYLEDALTKAELVCKNERNNATYLDTLADVCFNLGQVDRAIEIMERCLKMDANSEHYAEQLEKFKAGKTPEHKFK